MRFRAAHTSSERSRSRSGATPSAAPVPPSLPVVSAGYGRDGVTRESPSDSPRIDGSRRPEDPGGRAGAVEGGPADGPSTEDCEGKEPPAGARGRAAALASAAVASAGDVPTSAAEVPTGGPVSMLALETLGAEEEGMGGKERWEGGWYGGASSPSDTSSAAEARVCGSKTSVPPWMSSEEEAGADATVKLAPPPVPRTLAVTPPRCGTSLRAVATRALPERPSG